MWLLGASSVHGVFAATAAAEISNSQMTNLKQIPSSKSMKPANRGVDPFASFGH
jgi:hypothetical protein